MLDIFNQDEEPLGLATTITQFILKQHKVRDAQIIQYLQQKAVYMG